MDKIDISDIIYLPFPKMVSLQHRINIKTIIHEYIYNAFFLRQRSVKFSMHFPHIIYASWGQLLSTEAQQLLKQVTATLDSHIRNDNNYLLKGNRNSTAGKILHAPCMQPTLTLTGEIF